MLTVLDVRYGGRCVVIDWSHLNAHFQRTPDAFANYLSRAELFAFLYHCWADDYLERRDPATDKRETVVKNERHQHWGLSRVAVTAHNAGRWL